MWLGVRTLVQFFKFMFPKALAAQPVQVSLLSTEFMNRYRGFNHLEWWAKLFLAYFIVLSGGSRGFAFKRKGRKWSNIHWVLTEDRPVPCSSHWSQDNPCDTGLHNLILWKRKMRLSYVEWVYHVIKSQDLKASLPEITGFLQVAWELNGGHPKLSTLPQEWGAQLSQPFSHSLLSILGSLSGLSLCKNMPSCFCMCVSVPWLIFLFESGVLWAVVFHGSAATQTGQRKVGSLFFINTMTHMSS